MSHECKKYINDFFIIAELTKELELINFSKIINRIIIVKLKDNEFIISPCSDLDEHDWFWLLNKLNLLKKTN